MDRKCRTKDSCKSKQRFQSFYNQRWRVRSFCLLDYPSTFLQSLISRENVLEAFEKRIKGLRVAELCHEEDILREYDNYSPNSFDFAHSKSLIRFPHIHSIAERIKSSLTWISRKSSELSLTFPLLLTSPLISLGSRYLNFTGFIDFSSLSSRSPNRFSVHWTPLFTYITAFFAIKRIGFLSKLLTAPAAMSPRRQQPFGNSRSICVSKMPTGMSWVLHWAFEMNFYHFIHQFSGGVFFLSRPADICGSHSTENECGTLASPHTSCWCGRWLHRWSQSIQSRVWLGPLYHCRASLFSIAFS